MARACTPASPSIEAVLLDAAGTLITPAEPVGETYARIAGQFGADADPDRLMRAFGEAFRCMPPMAFPPVALAELERREKDWWRRLVQDVMNRTNTSINDFDACFNTLYAHFADSGGWRLYPEVLDVLTHLRGNGIALAVVSNFDSRLMGILDALGVASLLEEVVYSTAAGVAKPNPGIFHQALKTLGVDCTRAVHVGDGQEPDYFGARAAGLHALLLGRGGTIGDIPSEHRIRDLDGVGVWINTHQTTSGVG